MLIPPQLINQDTAQPNEKQEGTKRIPHRVKTRCPLREIYGHDRYVINHTATPDPPAD